MVVERRYRAAVRRAAGWNAALCFGSAPKITRPNKTLSIQSLSIVGTASHEIVTKNVTSGVTWKELFGGDAGDQRRATVVYVLDKGLVGR